MTRFQVTHRTRYEYEQDVVPSYGQSRLLPHDWPNQTVHAARLTISPTPEDVHERTDFHGNRSVHFSIHDPHRELVLEAVSEVEVASPTPGDLGDGPPWEHVRDLVAAGAVDPVAVAEYVLDSQMVAVTPRLVDYATTSFTPERGIVAAVRDLASRINHDFEFKRGVTSVTSTIEDLLEGRAGVCQDFTHFMIGCVRAVGLPAAYVSGYIETIPPPGKQKVRGADVSHAWVMVHCGPDLGWLHVDPTNDQLVNDRYVLTARGRDYRDITPLRGIIFTEGGTESLDVSVDVHRLAD